MFNSKPVNLPLLQAEVLAKSQGFKNDAINPHLKTISSSAILNGATVVEIEHKGARYLLRQTSLGKLILTK